MTYPSIAKCQICNLEKEICCAYWDKDGYCYCKNCCPSKKQHIKMNEEIKRRKEQEENSPELSLEERIEILENKVAELMKND